MKTIRKTIIGGFVFLLPITVIIFFLGEAIDLAMLVAEPLSDFIMLDAPGVLAANLLAVSLLAIVCYIAGIIATATPIQALSARGDRFFTENLPGYMFLKMFVGSVVGPDELEKDFKPILYEAFNIKHIGFEVERSDDGLVTIFLPSTPIPWSGSTMIVREETVTYLDKRNVDALGPAMRLGKGSIAVAKSV